MFCILLILEAGFGCCPLKDSGSVVVDSSKIYCCPHYLWSFCVLFLFSCAILRVPFLVLPSSRAGCFTLTVYLMYSECWYPVPWMRVLMGYND